MFAILSQKRCGRCGETKPTSEFSRNVTKKDGYSGTCKECFNKINAAYKAKNIEHTREQDREYYEKNKEIILAKALEKYKEKQEYNRKRHQELMQNPVYGEKKRHTEAASRKRLREQAFEVLGSVCVRCGYSDKRALQIDHINGGGRKERQKLSPTMFYKRVIEVGRKEYQTLCANCNHIKRLENDE